MFEEFTSVFKYCSIILIASSIIGIPLMLLSVKPIDYQKNRYKNNMLPLGSKKPNIILLFIDGLSARHMSLYGLNENTTPNIDKLAKESYVFNNMHSVSNDTIAYIASQIEGVKPSTHSINYTYFMNYTPFGRKNLITTLGEAGYTTYAIDIPYILGLGYSNSFYYTEPMLDASNILLHLSLRYRIPLYAWLNQIINEDLLWLKDVVRISYKKIFLYHKSAKYDRPDRLIKYDLPADVFRKVEQCAMNSKEPYFIWAYEWSFMLQSYLPKPYRGMFLKEDIENVFAEFDKEVQLYKFYPSSKQGIVDKIKLRQYELMAFVDYKVGEFIKFLKKNNIFDNCILIITSDHGKSFSKGYLSHSGPLLHEELTHIPLIIHMPNQKNGKIIESMATSIDIYPTILELCEIDTPENIEGESLVQFMENPNLLTNKPKFSMAVKKIGNDVEYGIIAIFKGGYKLIYDIETQEAELYNLIKDPSEEKDISKENKDIVENLKNHIRDNIRN